VARARLTAGLAALLFAPLLMPGHAAQQAPALPGAQGNPGVPTETPPSGEAKPNAPPAQSWQPRAAAELQALDKIDNRLATLNVPVGQSIQFEQLTITVRACMVRPPDQPADAASYLQIVDSRPGAPGFHGWMLGAEPSVSMLQHPDFDVRLVACH
jgi:hypothetical protein